MWRFEALIKSGGAYRPEARTVTADSWHGATGASESGRAVRRRGKAWRAGFLGWDRAPLKRGRGRRSGHASEAPIDRREGRFQAGDPAGLGDGSTGKERIKIAKAAFVMEAFVQRVMQVP